MRLPFFSPSIPGQSVNQALPPNGENKCDRDTGRQLCLLPLRGFYFVSSSRRSASSPFVSFTLFIRNADELKPHSISWVSFLHLFNTLISQFSLHPTTRSLISCGDGKESGGVDWLVLSQGPFGPVFQALQVCVNIPMKPSVVHPNVASHSVTPLLFTSETPAQDICFIRFPFWVYGTFGGACPDPDYSVS